MHISVQNIYNDIHIPRPVHNLQTTKGNISTLFLY